MSFRPTHATSVVEQSKEDAMYSCYVQDPTRYILAAFRRRKTRFSKKQRRSMSEGFR